MDEYELISVKDVKRWRQTLNRFKEFDIYHLPEYHLIAKELGEGEPFLFLYKDDDGAAALPFLVRDISDINGLSDFFYNDAISVYGYPGILTTVDKNSPFAENFRLRFQKALKETLKDLSIVTFFSRTNPLIPTSWLFENISNVVHAGATIVIDLSKPESDQLKDISKGHKYDMRKAKRNGVIVIEDAQFEHLDKFISIYNETMNRVNSEKYYYFAKDYYPNLINKLGRYIKLYFAKLDEVFIGASMFFCFNGIIQYHLSGTPLEYIKYSGAKVILDNIRQWGIQNGYKWLHLGGGVGSSEDHLYRFKAGFSKKRYPFYIVKMISEPLIYRKLCEQRKLWLNDHGFAFTDKIFCPGYRAPYESIYANEEI